MTNREQGKLAAKHLGPFEDSRLTEEVGENILGLARASKGGPGECESNFSCKVRAGV